MKKSEKKREHDYEWIKVRGAKTHNLKNINMQIPRGEMSVITGLSGSGKSSLAFDTIFAEGQRRYIESLSAYARQFLGQMQKAEVEEITGLTPAISIDQKTRSNNPRSTVATITEIYDYLRVLFARVGRPHCLVCGDMISKLSVDEMVDILIEKVETEILTKQEEGQKNKEIAQIRVDLFAPIVRNRKGQHYQALYDFLKKGYSHVRVDGELLPLREKIEISEKKKHNIELLIDQFYFAEFLESESSSKKDLKTRLSESFEKSISESDSLALAVFFAESKKESFLEKEVLFSSDFSCPKDGFSYGEIEPRNFSFNSPVGACLDCSGLGVVALFSEEACKTCNGKRLKEESLSVYIGPKDKKSKGLNISDVVELNIAEAHNFFEKIKLDAREKKIASPVLREIIARLSFLNNVGIDYISLSRRANTLSGGEAQRIRLASQIGSGLVGATYVLDEPTIGLHQRDNARLIETLKKIRDLGNTVIVVEHDEDVIYASSYIVDIGPLAGKKGGEVVAEGFLDELLGAPENKTNSRTLAYLRNEEQIEIPEKRRTAKKGEMKVTGANIFNIKNQNISIPFGKLTCITGVSGSGKSTFLHKVLYKNIDFYEKNKKKWLAGKVKNFQNCSDISGMEQISRTVLINQSPIGRTPRSNPATYTGAFSFIRELYAQTTEGKMRGYKAGRFSFNVPGGRCEPCSGNGYNRVEMHFLPDVFVKCDVCMGKRFSTETLEVTYKNKNITDVLEMDISDALKFFGEIPQISDRLIALVNVGLGYLKLGQFATTLSGGEAQRVKIASELYRPHTEKTLYLLDEPTVGLHYDDVAKLNKILQLLVDKGNTVVVIEHNLDLIKIADHLIDFGPDGGDRGGKVVAKGTPEEVCQNENSLTGKYLKKVLTKKARK